MSIDTLTVIFLLVFSNLVVFLFLLILIFSSKLKAPLFKTYALGKIILSIAFVVMAFRNVIPEEVSILFGNLLLFVSIVLEVFCAVHVWQEFNRKKLLYYFIPVLIIYSLFVIFSQSSANVRIIIASTVSAGYFSWGGIQLLFFDKKHALKHLMSLFYLFTGFIFFWRIYIAAFQNPDIDLYTASNPQLLGYIMLFFVGHMGVIYILIANKEQDEEIILKINQHINEDNLQLKEMNAMKDKFFSVIAHDLKTPIGSLSQLLGVLAEDDNQMEPERRQKILETVHKNSKSTFMLLNNLLLWARSQSNQIRFEPSEVEVKKITEENIRLIVGSAEIKKIEIKNNCLDWQVFADRDMLRAVIRNLLSNAVKFTPKGGVVKMACKRLSDEMLEILITDTGTGIEKKILPELLNINSDYTTLGTNRERGTGLGLKLCREFVERNGGKIWIDSTEGQGTQVGFTVPLVNNS